MEKDEKVSKYMKNAEEWLNASKSLMEKTSEPAAFNALHGAELAAKAALIHKTGKEYKTHNIGGEFGKHFREKIGKQICRELNNKMMKYSTLRYPEKEITKKEAKQIINFSEKLIKTIKQKIIQKKPSK